MINGFETSPLFSEDLLCNFDEFFNALYDMVDFRAAERPIAPLRFTD